MLVFLNVTDKICKCTKDTDAALQLVVFQGIYFHRERVCQLLFRFIQGHKENVGKG